MINNTIGEANKDHDMLELQYVRRFRAMSERFKMEARETMKRAELISIKEPEGLCKANTLTGRAQGLQYAAEAIEEFLRENIIS